MNDTTLAAYAKTKILWARMLRELDIPENSMFVDLEALRNTKDYLEYNRAMNYLQLCLRAQGD